MEVVHFTNPPGANSDSRRLARRAGSTDGARNQKQLATRWGVSEARLPHSRSRDRPQVPEALRPGPLPAGRHRSLRGVVSGNLDQKPWRAGGCRVRCVT
jgi:hypothetical protein